MLPEWAEAEPDDNQPDHRARGARRDRSVTRIESGGEEDDKSAHQVNRIREDNTTLRRPVSGRERGALAGGQGDWGFFGADFD